ncbi:30S ribosomal protein S11 [Candidatus Beckwithbacteria bacterium]|nr:30S ribosomal protein S11 [Candidatus Beckwithbacteria bacterium]
MATVSKAKNKQVTNGRVYVTATFNNTLVMVTNEEGDALCWGSSGSSGFKGSRKSTPYAATTAIDKVIQEAKQMGLKQVKVFIKGPGVGRDAALRVLRSSGVKVSMIADVTPIPHNGCRPKKRRRA